MSKQKSLPAEKPKNKLPAGKSKKLPVNGKPKKSLPVKGKETPTQSRKKSPSRGRKITPTQIKTALKTRRANVHQLPVPKGWLTTGEVAKMLGFVDHSYVSRLCSGGGLVGDPKLVGRKYEVMPGLYIWYVDPKSVAVFKKLPKPARGRVRGKRLSESK